MERHLAVELDRDANGVGQIGAMDVADRHERSWSLRRRSLRDRLRRLRARGRGVARVHARKLRRHLGDEAARRVAGRQSSQQPDARVAIDRLSEAGERIEREASRLPERVVAVAAGGVASDDRFVRSDLRADLFENARRRVRR